MARVLLADVFLSDQDLLPGSKFQQLTWLNRLSSWPKKVAHPLKSVLFSETTTVFLKLKVWLEARFSESWKRTVLPQKSPKIFITLLRRPLMWESIWRDTERIRMENSDSFLLRAESTDSHVITEEQSNFHPHGNTSQRKLMPSSHDRGLTS